MEENSSHKIWIPYVYKERREKRVRSQKKRGCYGLKRRGRREGEWKGGKHEERRGGIL